MTKVYADHLREELRKLLNAINVVNLYDAIKQPKIHLYKMPKENTVLNEDIIYFIDDVDLSSKKSVNFQLYRLAPQPWGNYAHDEPDVDEDEISDCHPRYFSKLPIDSLSSLVDYNFWEYFKPKDTVRWIKTDPLLVITHEDLIRHYDQTQQKVYDLAFNYIESYIREEIYILQLLDSLRNKKPQAIRLNAVLCRSLISPQTLNTLFKCSDILEKNQHIGIIPIMFSIFKDVKETGMRPRNLFSRDFMDFSSKNTENTFIDQLDKIGKKIREIVFQKHKNDFWDFFLSDFMLENVVKFSEFGLTQSTDDYTKAIQHTMANNNFKTAKNLW